MKKRKAKMNTQEFKQGINKNRKTNKDNWYYWQGMVNGKSISLKGFNTWLQVFKIDGVDYSGSTDISVKDFNLLLDSVD